MKILNKPLFSKMTDAEHQTWVKSLTPVEYDYWADKTFVAIEFVVSTLDENVDVIDNNHFDTLAEATKEFNAISGNAIVERCKNYYNCIDRNLEDREYTILMKKP